jgi:hypothetical protein
MTGCFVTTALLVMAGALAIGARRHGSAITQERRFPTAGFVLAVGATLAVAVAFLFAADRGAMGTLTRMAGVLNVAPPPGYHAVSTLATADWVATLERDLGVAAFGGTALGLASLAWVMFAGRRIDRFASHLSIARTLAVFAGAASVGSVWFATHFHAASAWLRALER